ncbi:MULTISPECIES: cupin-like domain-containing protein [unclassified Moorena]|uniref:cupin-like domain-containing protein n=1 Tax=unclassified Moorena TaxID=2683338 RepID=UPI0013BA8470|nr:MULTISPECIES: cupin-like domain-containing protein [unclassified Moorena]NER88924.1 cupin-like domain-containing protein [Moorena sp. SIO3A2]NES41391.1 cupin-like domain-containing protein [Moorena sp. SIO2C4]NES82251.1 cupin-like domain-containing protein [Moorena sp. SIO2B7]NET65594.1 cupin-like domain-containing protein [Moorena sp. SIO1G6]
MLNLSIEQLSNHHPINLKNPIPVAEVKTIDNETFANEYVAKHRPVIIRQGIQHWQAMQWEDDYLKKVVGEQPVKVYIFSYYQEGKVNLKDSLQEKMSVADFIERYKSIDKNYYISDQNLFPVLHQDLGTHPVLETFPISRRRTLFWGNGGQKSHLHYDDNENIMCQCDGEKEFLLFDITDFKYLYPATPEQFISAIDLDRLDSGQFPLLNHATPYVARIKKGDILYVPCYWWHRVTSFGRNIAVSYIINETMAQRLNVVEKLVDCDTLPVDESVKNDLLAIIRSEEKASKRNAQLKKYHRKYLKEQGTSYYFHQIFRRLIEESLFDILYGHSTY